MSEAKETGGPAFPTDPKNHGYEGAEGTGADSGMTLRDYFASQCLTGLIGHGNNLEDTDLGEDASYAKIVASQAYFIADEMIKARKR